MRRSSRLATGAITVASKEITKGTKRSREGSGSASEKTEVDPSRRTSTTAPIKPPKKKSKTGQKAALGAAKDAKSKKQNKGRSKVVKAGKTLAHIKTEVKNVKTVMKDVDSISGGKAPREKPGTSVYKIKTEATPTYRKFIGAHVSIIGGLQNAVYGAVELGAKAFGMFLRSQRQWNSKPLDDRTAKLFKEACESEGFSPNTILPHGIYLMNCGSPDDNTLAKSREVFVEELQRCEKLGLTLYNFHPGSSCGKITVEECLDRIAESINIAHSKTKYVIPVIENMSCQGHTIGGKFEELRGIIDRVNDKCRVGVCLDTCHAFAAGHNISTAEGYEEVMENFDKIVGLKYLKAIHLNDSKGKLGCHLDRHENIGKGWLGKECFRRIMQDPRFDGIPMILETPNMSDDTYTKEIQLLYSMVK